MEIIDEYLNQLGEKRTDTLWTLYNDLSAATLTFTAAAPAVPFKCSLQLLAVDDHTDCAGRVTVNAEATDFTQAGTKTTTTTLTTLPTGTTANLDCQVIVKAITAAGGPIYLYSYEEFACRWVDSNKLIMTALGAWTQAEGIVFTKEVFEVGDYIRKKGTTAEYPIVSMVAVVDLDGIEQFRKYTI